MKNKEYSFSEYMDNSKELFKKLFGVELYNKLNKIPLKSIDWEGIDIDTCEITATFPNIKERFSPKWIEYWEEREPTLLDLYLQTIFHYGYQQCKDHNKSTEEFANKIIMKMLDMKDGEEKEI